MTESQNTNESSSYEKVMDEVHHFLDVPMKITVQLANCNMKVRDILQLQPSSIVDLPKSAGENVDILINERLIGFGEVMELEGCTGIRLTDLNIVT
ncbi:MAG: FliM/FliN family flagellar motor switch protein [Acidobacteriota bacterium]|jgi:flagellar motor switch protein FliN/FliY|nr:FliM/FliN family flagellar motor switch protein [Acidobacteriota bacterium]